MHVAQRYLHNKREATIKLTTSSDARKCLHCCTLSNFLFIIQTKRILFQVLASSFCQFHSNFSLLKNLSKLNFVQEHIIFQENNVFPGKLLFGGLLFSKFITFNTDDADFFNILYLTKKGVHVWWHLRNVSLVTYFMCSSARGCLVSHEWEERTTDASVRGRNCTEWTECAD